MDVRSAEAGDVALLAALRADWRRGHMTPEYATAFARWFEQEETSRWWWLAVVDGEAVGMVNLKVFDRMPSPVTAPSRWGYLGNLFVVEGARGHGVGGQLVQAVLDRAHEEALVRVVVSPSERSRPLYERLGFAPADELLVCRL